MRKLLKIVVRAIREERYTSIPGFIGVGAFRVVVEHPTTPGMVIKIARNEYGRKDNAFEAALSRRADVARYFPEVMSAAADHRWLIVKRYEPVHDCAEYTDAARRHLDLALPWAEIFANHFPTVARELINDNEKWNFGIAEEACGYRLVCLDPYSTWVEGRVKKLKIAN